ncbi:MULTISPECIES: cytochrome C [Rhodopseudomonas]|uniref:Cytochrome C n=1 Tax=Rhodopseudomonas telluris TaxID=644215 RepID=A0ABV6EZJ3_9BRAD
MTRHRWGEPKRFPPFKTERECLNGCGIVKVTRHESEGPRDIHWQEFWRDGEQIRSAGTPVCEPVPAPAV